MRSFKNLREQLKAILPDILPRRPQDSIKGTELIRLVKFRIKQDYSEATLRYHFSIMCYDPTSPIAKVEQGQGYYLREAYHPKANGQREKNGPARQATFEDMEDSGEDARDLKNLEKFRAIYHRYCELNARFPFVFDHKHAVDGDDTDWTVPDMAVVEWELGDPDDEGFALDGELLQMKQQLGSQPFRITASRLQLEVNHATLRRDFFRCLSCSSWAHGGEMVIAHPVDDEKLLQDLRVLGNRFDLAVTSFGMDPTRLDEHADAKGIHSMKPSEFEALLSEVRIQRISSGNPAPLLDWASLTAARQESTGFDRLIRWVNSCCKQRRAKTFRQYEGKA
jgi:hypothetical protein